MKKATLLATGLALAALPAAAQSPSGLLDRPVFVGERSYDLPTRKGADQTTANKATDGATGGWFNYVDARYITGTTSGIGYPMYPDSTIVYTRTPSTTYQFFYGVGMSFDPTSLAYSGDALNPADVPDFVVRTTDPYRLDSFYTFFRYNRRAYNGANTVDTMQVDLVRTSATNPLTFRRQYAASAAGAAINAGDSIVRYASATYDPVRNQISDSIATTERFRFKYPLTAALWADSNANGTQDLQFPIPNGLSVAAGEVLVAYISFKPGSTYPFGRLLDSTNHIRLVTYEIDGADSYIKQFGRDHTAFLWTTKQSKYVPPYTAFTVNGHRALIPSTAYTDRTGFGLPYMSFFLTCPSCDQATGVSTLSNSVKNVTVVPNPANEQVEVRFTLATAADVNVSLTNLMGQTVATQALGNKDAGALSTAKFDVSSLPAGVYLYTVDAAGQKQTGRLVVTR